MNIQHKNGFSLVETVIVMGIFSVLMGGISLVVFSGQSFWMTVDSHIRLQENLRNALARVSQELQETGSDQGVMQLTITDSVGPNNSDVIRFSIPVCVCSNMTIDANGDVPNWGAPLTWGSVSCITDVNTIIPGPNQKVDICHLPPGNPGNTQDLNVSINAVAAHLSHGDWVGSCTVCTTDNAKFIEYRLDGDNQLVRRVLDLNLAVVREDIFAQGITDFQASLNGAQDIATIIVTALQDTDLNRALTRINSMDVYLRNKE